MTCPDLCTAEKCAELENLIGYLQQKIDLLEAAFEAHVYQDIPNAHKYNPTLKISTNIEDNITHYTQYIDIYLDDIYGFTQVDLPNNYNEPHIMYEIHNLDDSNYEFRFNYNGIDYYANLELPASEPPFVIADIFDLGNNQFNLSVGVDGEFDESFFEVKSVASDLNNHPLSNLVGSASFRNDVLTISIADGESQDSFSVYLPIADSTQTIFTTEQIYMNCDELEQLIKNFENNVTNQLITIENAVSIDISGEVDSEFACTEETNTEDNSTSIVPSFNPITYQGLGLSGLHEMLKLTNNNLTTIFSELCNQENQDVVSLVVSDKYITAISGKLLILHFVTFDNYPKRGRNSSYREVQIPAPKETFTWAEDFKNLRWYQGNQYAELRFKENYVPVAGWFKDEAAANSYFDAVLTLTTATEDNRVYPKHSNPKMAIPEQETRPYRAFIESVNEQGQAVCEIKFTPPKENEST